MKKTLRFLPLLFVALLGLTAWSCSDDKDEPISSNELPTAAQAFVSTYFPSAKIITTTKDKDEFEVTLSEGTRIEFNKAGEWLDVDAAPGKTVPSGFYPESIDSYIETVLGGVGINEISKEPRGLDIELVNGIDIYFTFDGDFIGYDFD